MHLQALQREKESSFNMKKNYSKSDFTQITEPNEVSGSKLAQFLKPTGYKPMMILFWIFLIQQFSGIYITLLYAVTFIRVSELTKLKIRCDDIRVSVVCIDIEY